MTSEWLGQPNNGQIFKRFKLTSCLKSDLNGDVFICVAYHLDKCATLKYVLGIVIGNMCASFW